MNILPKTKFGTYKVNQAPIVLTVWSSWLWLNYGHKEFYIKGLPLKPPLMIKVTA